jgi:hypothetical protein
MLAQTDQMARARPHLCRVTLTHGAQSLISTIASAEASGQTVVVQFLQQQFATNITAALANIKLEDVYAELQKTDKSRGSDTSEDPSLDEMIAREKAAEAQNPQ